MNLQIKKSFLLLILATAISLSGCAGQQSRTKSSVIDYLYPNKSEIVVQPSIPVLHIPIKVGIAFVPDQQSGTRGRNMWSGFMRAGALTEANKASLLKKAADHFSAYEFVSDIEIIPSAYLTPGGSFQNLEQIKTMYGIDVIALVSYDQVQFTDEDMLSLTYWTLVGAYIFSGEKNDTSTMIDIVVYDINSKKMLFRAPGTSNIKGTSTPINLSEQLRKDSLISFENATDDAIKNLDIQLELFRDKIKKSPEKVKVIQSKGYSGGVGSFSLVEATLLPFFIAISNLKKKSRTTSSVNQQVC